MSFAKVRAAITSRPATAAAIVIGALVPVFGVLFLNWNAGEILVLFWIENVIVGALTAPRILAAGRAGPASLFLTGFFLFHYGFFCAVHLVFVLLLAGGFLGRQGELFDPLTHSLAQPAFLWGIAAIAVLDLVSQIRDWWLPGRWRDATPQLEMGRPYGRIIVLHMTILIGAWAALSLGAPVWSVVILCLMKAALELGLLGFSGFGLGKPVEP